MVHAPPRLRLEPITLIQSQTALRAQHHVLEYAFAHSGKSLPDHLKIQRSPGCNSCALAAYLPVSSPRVLPAHRSGWIPCRAGVGSLVGSTPPVPSAGTSCGLDPRICPTDPAFSSVTLLSCYRREHTR